MCWQFGDVSGWIDRSSSPLSPLKIEIPRNSLVPALGGSPGLVRGNPEYWTPHENIQSATQVLSVNEGWDYPRFNRNIPSFQRCFHLVGGLEHVLFSIIYGMSSFPLTFIFFKMVKITNQSWFMFRKKMVLWEKSTTPQLRCFAWRLCISLGRPHPWVPVAKVGMPFCMMMDWKQKTTS